MGARKIEEMPMVLEILPVRKMMVPWYLPAAALMCLTVPSTDQTLMEAHRQDLQGKGTECT